MPHSHESVLYARRLFSEPPKLTANEKEALSRLDLPLHVLTTGKSARRNSKTLTSHLWNGPLHKGTILDSGKGFYVVSPEFCFALMAKTLSIPKLIELGFELCGIYDIFRGAIYKAKPLTTVSRLKAFVSKMQNFHGKRKALRALSFVLENSASPMETTLTMLLCLPYRLGGYGLPKPSLNHRIDLPYRKHYDFSAEFYVCDLYWPKTRLAVEYDSNQFHTGEERIVYDSCRRLDLMYIKITVLTVTWDQVKDVRMLDDFANRLSKRLGKRLRLPEAGFPQARQALRKELLGSKSQG